MLFDLQNTQRSPEGVPVIVTDLVTSNKHRLKTRAQELKRRGHHVRIVPQSGPYMSAEEFEDLP